MDHGKNLLLRWLSGRLGVLRAVVPVADLHSFLSKDGSKYVGKSFPKMMKEAGTVIEVAADERGPWKTGFYHATKGPLDFEDHLQSLEQGS